MGVVNCQSACSFWNAVLGVDENSEEDVEYDDDCGADGLGCTKVTGSTEDLLVVL